MGWPGLLPGERAIRSGGNHPARGADDGADPSATATAIATPTGPDRAPTDRWREMAPIVAVVALALVVLGGLAVLPARTWLTQRQNMHDAQTELTQTQADVDGLQSQLQLLQTDAEVERLARQNFDLVYPGEESYRVVPPGPASTPSSSQQSSPAGQ